MISCNRNLTMMLNATMTIVTILLNDKKIIIKSFYPRNIIKHESYNDSECHLATITKQNKTKKVH